MGDKEFKTAISYNSELREAMDLYRADGESRSQFIRQAVVEKINRCRAKNKTARKAELLRDAELLRPVVEEILKEKQAGV